MKAYLDGDLVCLLDSILVRGGLIVLEPFLQSRHLFQLLRIIEGFRLVLLQGIVGDMLLSGVAVGGQLGLGHDTGKRDPFGHEWGWKDLSIHEGGIYQKTPPPGEPTW